MRTRYRVLAATTLPLAVALALAPLARADTRTFHDKRYDGDFMADVSTVRVSNGKSRIAVAARVGGIGPTDKFTIWIDTKPSNKGPEYKATVLPDSADFKLKRVGSFSDKGKTARCDGLREVAEALGDDLVKISVPRSCMGNPGKVRVSLRAQYDFPGVVVTDWAPGRKKSFEWVAR